MELDKNQTPFRCAIYTRKSTEEGLEQEYNTLDAQRDAGEAYVKSQQHEGWSFLPDRYDDGGFTGANMERPALQRLMQDIQDGRVNCVVVYKVDRLSRSLMDFSRIMETFDRHGVAFVSVTQAFNTGSSMGRLVLNVLLSFAQFEREMISERTRDKIAAARRKGKWAGGRPVLGYNVKKTKLQVNQEEASQVREIFQLYLKYRSTLEVARILNDRGWRTKRWVTGKGKVTGGREFDKTHVHKLLTSPVYIGKVCYKTEVHEGEHDAIIDPEVYEKAQSILKGNAICCGLENRNKHKALLRGLLRCETCNCGMSHSFTTKGTKVYRYYVCQKAQKRGWDACPAPSIPAGEIEGFVINEIKAIGKNERLIQSTINEIRHQTEDSIKKLAGERSRLLRHLGQDSAELGHVAQHLSPESDRLSQLKSRIESTERRIAKITKEQQSLTGKEIQDQEVHNVFSDFSRLWGNLHPREQCRVTESLIQQVSYDGEAGRLSISYKPAAMSLMSTESQEVLA